MEQFLLQIFTNEYIFTFLVTFSSVVFKAYTSQQDSILKARQTYELGLEFMFIAISFAASNMAQITQYLDSKIKDKDYILEKISQNKKEGIEFSEAGLMSLKTEVIRFETEIQALNEAFSAMTLVVFCVIVSIALLIIMLRIYGYKDKHPNFIQGILVPNFLGIVSVILVLSLVYQP